MQYGLYRIEDDETTKLVSEHEDMLTGVTAATYAVEVEDHDFAYSLHSANGCRVAIFREGRIGYREWAMRNGRLQNEYIHSIDDRLDHDVDVALSR